MDIFYSISRAEWLKKIRLQAEALYDHIAPAYWVKFGMYPDVTHCQFIEKFLGRLDAHSAILDAACGAGRYDGLLLEAGHSVLGIDQSGNMLAQAREHFPQERFPGLRYAKIGLQEMDFVGEFNGVICMDALEHICPEDIPGILASFQKALRPGGMLYVTIDALELGDYREAYERANAMGLPVVFGEVANELDEVYAQAMALDALEGPILGERLDLSVYHYHPSMEQVRTWFDHAGLVIEEEGIEAEGPGEGYAHVLARKNA
jgi:2-polyprenyl-3-methyl-5-hydroxy-6-metoxy-1,4-benzoquinol methylase